MTSIFEWLFKYRPLLYERGTLDFQPVWPSYITWLILAAALLIPYFLYRRYAGVLPDSWRYGLISLRASAFLVILLIFLQPTLLLHSVVPQQNYVAVAYDFSKSMEIRDGEDGLSRLEVEKNLLRPENNPMLEALASKFKLKHFRFSGGAEQTDVFPDDARLGDITDLERSLNQISEEMATVPIAGVVLATDGADNHSQDLDRLATRFRARDVPIYTVGIGTESLSKDTEILEVTAPRTVLKDTVVETDVSVRSEGYAGRRAKLVVTEQGSQVQSQEIVLGRDDEVKTYKVNLSGQFEGPRIFNFHLEPLPGEVVEQNNEQTVLVRVEDARPKILYMEGEPRWEYGFLRRSISQDNNLHVVTLLRQADGKYLRQGIESPEALQQGFPVDKEELFKYKAIILGSVEASFFTFDQLRMISDFVSQRGGGFLMLGGRDSYGQGGYMNTPLEDILPVYLTPGTESDIDYHNLEFKVRLTRYGELHPICRLSLSESVNQQRWQDAPNLLGFNPTTGPKPGATVLARASVKDDPTQDPVILAFQRFGKGKTVAFTTASSWRWKMEQDHADDFHELFWRQMLRWLVSDVADPLTVTSERHSYSPDDIAFLEAEVNNESFIPLDNVRLSAHVKAPSGQITPVSLTLDYEKSGHYSGTFKPTEEGIHEVFCEAFEGTQSLGSAESNFRVAESMDEFHQASLNSSLLRRLSEETGGRYYSASEAGSLAEDISYTDKGVSQMEEKDLWDAPFLFLVLIGFISTEWILRKRKGLS